MWTMCAVAGDEDGHGEGGRIQPQLLPDQAHHEELQEWAPGQERLLCRWAPYFYFTVYRYTLLPQPVVLGTDI
jgi:hypothetical protein